MDFKKFGLFFLLLCFQLHTLLALHFHADSLSNNSTNLGVLLLLLFFLQFQVHLLLSIPDTSMAASDQFQKEEINGELTIEDKHEIRVVRRRGGGGVSAHGGGASEHGGGVADAAGGAGDNGGRIKSAGAFIPIYAAGAHHNRDHHHHGSNSGIINCNIGSSCLVLIFVTSFFFVCI